MIALDTAKNLAKPFEGKFLVVYKCPAGYWTIGWGHRCNPDHPPISNEQAEIYLNSDMLQALNGAIRQCPVLLKHPRRLAAIADFCFNLGIGRLQTSTLRRKINNEDWTEAVTQLLRWNKANGQVLKGLVKRRFAEAVLLK